MGLRRSDRAVHHSSGGLRQHRQGLRWWRGQLSFSSRRVDPLSTLLPVGPRLVGDTAAAYVRVENPAMPDRPDILFQGCTMVSPQRALKAGNYGFTTFSYIGVENCRLITLNFSQPHGTPTDGIIQSVEHGRYLQVDLGEHHPDGVQTLRLHVAKESDGEIQYTPPGEQSKRMSSSPRRFQTEYTVWGTDQPTFSKPFCLHRRTSANLP